MIVAHVYLAVGHLPALQVGSIDVPDGTRSAEKMVEMLRAAADRIELNSVFESIVVAEFPGESAA